MPSAHHVAAPHAGSAPGVRLPDAVGPFRRSAATRTVMPADIFEYMDGAGELYLAYRFDRLEVTEYASDGDGEILVELYRMRGSDDAYGLLSQDWGGEPVVLSEAPAAPGRRALYGSGLLRLWSGDLFARVMATRESEAARAAVLDLGRAIVAGRAEAPPPRLVTSLPAQPAPGYGLAGGGACFLRSHLVLNSAYFVSQRDILDLGPQTEAVFAAYRGSAGRPRLLLVRYPDAAAARRAVAGFRAAYLPEAGADDAGPVRVEDGWVALSASGRGLAIVFAAPDRATAEAFLAAGRAALASLEASHG